MCTRLATLSISRRSIAVGCCSPRAPRREPRDTTYGATVWQETQNVEWSRAALGQSAHQERRPSMYEAAAWGLQEDVLAVDDEVSAENIRDTAETARTLAFRISAFIWDLRSFQLTRYGPRAGGAMLLSQAAWSSSRERLIISSSHPIPESGTRRWMAANVRSDICSSSVVS